MRIPAPASHRLTEVYQWLIASATQSATPAPATLAIEAFGMRSDPLGPSLRRHLSEYDCDDSQWLAIDSALLAVLREDLSCLRLLGHSATSAGALPPLELLVARRGHVILEGPGMLAATAGEENTFRVALCRETEAPAVRHFHLAANPAGFDAECLTAVIGDAFAEWMNARQHAVAGSENPRSLR